MRQRLFLLGVVGTLLTGSYVLAGVSLPADGAILNYLHVPFRWDAIEFGGDPNALYQLVVVEDNGNEDPFLGAAILLNIPTIGAEPPRYLAKTSLEFGKSYAWRVRGFLYDPLPWSATYRFTTAPLPEWFPGVTVTAPEGGGEVEPGVTLVGGVISQSGNIPDAGGLFFAVDATGRVIYHHTTVPRGFGPDLRLLDNGRILWVGAGDRAFETTLTGAVAWASPELYQLDAENYPSEYQNKVHHECQQIPNGDELVIYYEWQDVVRDGEVQRWKGDRLVVLDRHTGDEVWSWSTFDHFSTLDFDPTTMATPSPFGDYNWTHSNAVFYNEDDNSMYLSSRVLSRITKINYDTGEIDWIMGFDMPSGDAEFGDNLFSFQHAVEMLPDGNMLLFDNGNRRDHIDHTSATGTSRAMELQFSDDVPPVATIVWEWEAPAFSAFLGDADRLPGGNTLVTVGALGIVTEVDADSNEVWQLAIDEGGAPAWAIYRAERVPSLILDTPGDTDGDWDLDVLDFGRAQSCFTGSGPAGLQFPCTLSDVDGDDDVDRDDVGILVEQRTGPLQ